MTRWWLVLVAGCGLGTTTVEQQLSTEVTTQRYTLIRDSAAEMGMYNGALLAGIAISETNLAHCQSEATYACKGPASPSCNGGPIIAGAADGPCSAQQGGLGMFQFDAGTYDQTVTAYGPSILTVEGNTAQAVSFVVDKVELDIPNIDDWLAATSWMNRVPLDPSDAVMNQWAKLLACRYNGCCSASATCISRGNGYRDNAITAFEAMGADFWTTDNRCKALPADGVIEQRSECYIAAGDPRYWRHVDGGSAGTLEWTGSTAATQPANFAEWIVKAPAGRYHVDIYLDGTYGTAKHARYQIAHAGTGEMVELDQTSATGYVSLGEFDFAGTGDEHVMLADNTGEASAQVGFDAVRVQPTDSTGPTTMDPPGGGCCQTGAGGGSGVLALGVVALLRRRRMSGRSATLPA
ncbi:hypothetical protein BH11MYX1_BH11MYX1_20310 [soil metagenome]